MAIITSVFAQETVVKHSGELDVSGGTVTDVGDDHDGDRARGSGGRCLAGS
jgi:hypothetical protein